MATEAAFPSEALSVLPTVYRLVHVAVHQARQAGFAHMPPTQDLQSKLGGEEDKI